LGDIAALLGELRAKEFACGIASSDSAQAVAETVATLRIGGLIDFQCGYDSGFGIKPQPGMVNAFCTATGLLPHQVAMVGDSTHDLHMGRAAGCGLVVGVLSGTGTHASLAAHADVLLASVADLPALLA
jgi:phosphoglycolate phosphatase